MPRTKKPPALFNIAKFNMSLFIYYCYVFLIHAALQLSQSLKIYLFDLNYLTNPYLKHFDIHHFD